MQQKLSVIIITFNEEKNIGRCLKSVLEVADEIIVVDSFSTDNTRKICEEFEQIKFYKNPFEGHIEQKNFAKGLATNNMVLSLDADEVLDETLKESIKKAKADFKYPAYQMNRLTNYCGQWIRYCGWYPDTKVRLFDKTKGSWGGINPHDKYIPEKGVYIGFLEGDILHYSFYTKEEHLAQIHKFSSIGAKALFEKGKYSNTVIIYVKAIARFLKTYVVKSGYLDGRNGFLISRLSAYSNYLKYSKLKNLRQGKAI